MNIEIHTHDRDLVSDFLGSSSASAKDEIQIADQVRLRYEGSHIRKAIGLPEIARFALTFGSGVAAGVAANWLYGKLKGRRVEKLIIERTEVDVNQGEIERVIEERLTVER